MRFAVCRFSPISEQKSIDLFEYLPAGLFQRVLPGIHHKGTRPVDACSILLLNCASLMMVIMMVLVVIMTVVLCCSPDGRLRGVDRPHLGQPRCAGERTDTVAGESLS